MQNSNSNHAPSKKLWSKIKAAFVLNDSTVTTWCKGEQKNVTNVRGAVIGSYDGPKAKAIRKEVIEASGLNKQAA